MIKKVTTYLELREKEDIEDYCFKKTRKESKRYPVNQFIVEACREKLEREKEREG